MPMPGVFTKLAQRIAAPPAPSREEQADEAERTESALALAREILHSIEQFIISTPDLDTSRFLQRMRGTAAGLTGKVDPPTIRLYQDWTRKAVGTFAGLQRRYVAEREEEMWRLLDLHSQFAVQGQSRSTELIDAIRTSHQKMRTYASLEDIREAREALEVEVKETQRLVAQKIREDKERIHTLARQVAQLEATLAAVRGQANYDVLTGIYHRGVFEIKLRELMSAGHPCGLAIVDIDSFKTINDTLGHPIGDRMLQQVAQVLNRVARTTDLVARYGGDEFCFLSVGATPEQLAQRLAGAVARRHVRLEIEEQRVVSVLLSLSVGVATSKTGEYPEQLLDRADQALLLAKRGGKGGIRMSTGDADF